MTNTHKHYETARRAYAWMSHNPERRALSECAFYDDTMREFSDNPTAQAKFERLFLLSLAAKSRCASSMITGPARFPVEKQRRSALDRINHPLIAITALCGFIWLSYVSEPYGHGYTEKERRDMDRLVESVTGHQKPVKRLSPEGKRKAIMDLWNLTEADIAKPVTLWRD